MLLAAVVVSVIAFAVGVTAAFLVHRLFSDDCQ